MRKNNITWKKAGYVALFYCIAILVRYYIVIAEPAFIREWHPIITGLLSGISPLIAGLLLIYGFKRRLNYSFFAVGKFNTIALILLPIVLFSFSEYIETGTMTSTLPLMISVSLLYGFFEEFGWRGYLQSELSVVKPIYKYLIISVLWYFWHFDFGLDLSHFFSYLFVLGGSIGMGYVADKSKSLVLPALFHAFSNIIFSNVIFKNYIYASFTSTLIIVAVCIVAIIGVMIKTSRQYKTSVVT